MKTANIWYIIDVTKRKVWSKFTLASPVLGNNLKTWKPIVKQCHGQPGGLRYQINNDRKGDGVCLCPCILLTYQLCNESIGSVHHDI